MVASQKNLVRKLKINTGMNRILMLICLFAIVVSGCRTTNVTSGTKPKKPKSIIKHAEQNQLKFTYLASKTKINYVADGKSTSFKGELRMKKDSVIWLSITPLLGIEIARVLIKPDTVHILDRINKVYYKKPTAYLASEFNAPIDFGGLQSMITGGMTFFDKKNASSMVENNMYIVETHNEALTNKAIIEPEYYRFTRTELAEKNTNRKISVDYNEYETVGEQPFSHQRDIQVDGDMALEIHLGFSKVKLDEAQRFSFTVSSKYEIVQ